MFDRMIKRIAGTIRNIFSSRLFVLALLFILMSVVLSGRLFYLQIVRGAYYLDNYKLQIRKTKEIAGARGNIYDRNGNLLAYNELAYSVTIEDDIPAGEDRNDRLNAIIDRVLQIVEAHGDSVIHDFGIMLDAAGNYQFSQSNETLRLRFIADVYGKQTIDELSDEQKAVTPEGLIHYVCTDETYGYGIDDTLPDKAYILKMVNMRYAIHLNSFQKYIPSVLASDVSDATAAAIMENLDKLDGVDIEEVSLRRYADSKYFASVIGYTGKISREEYDALDEEQKKRYSLSDIVGKSGIEQVMDTVLQGEKGNKVFYVDNVGKVTDTVSYKAESAGNDVYLTIDMGLQKQVYQLIEEKLAGIILSKLQNVMDYTPDPSRDSSEIIIPVSDAYHAFIGNTIIDCSHFGSTEAKETEREVYAIFAARKEEVLQALLAELNGGTPYKDLSPEMKAYLDHIESVLLNDTGILVQDAIDTSDENYKAWAIEETSSLNQYLKYAISRNWIDTSRLSGYITSERYSDATEAYQGLVDYLEEYLRSDINFDKLLYKYLIKSGSIRGAQICAIAYEQEVLPMDETAYNGLRTGTADPFVWLCDKIRHLEITPGQLALEPCTGSAIVSDPNTGEILACVSYPGYDNNRLANTMDTNYFNQLVNGLSSPFYNNATQERTAPGSTFKMVSAVAALTEGVITPDTYITCTGVYDRVTPSPRCWAYPGIHGALNVVDAIKFSCNYFFYEVGYRLGLGPDGEYDSDRGTDTLRKYAEMFGLGEHSGIEIPESDPQISDEYSIQSAIGQGTNNYTVSQLNRYVSAIANKGTLYNLTLLEKTTDSNGKIIKDYGPVVAHTIDAVSASTWDDVQQGMINMINNSYTFSGMGIQMAGKTGTAQQSALHPDHVLFVGFAPADSPEIAITVRIANGYNSGYASEIGRDIVRLRYQLADVNKVITGQASELGTTIAGD